MVAMVEARQRVTYSSTFDPLIRGTGSRGGVGGRFEA